MSQETGEILVANYETGEHLAILDVRDGAPNLTILAARERTMRSGEWVGGWYCGSSRRFLAVFWHANAMCVANAGHVHEVHLAMDGERLDLTIRGPVAELSVSSASTGVLRYRYVRTACQWLERNRYPEHELPRWLVEGWRKDRGYFVRTTRSGNGRLFQVVGS